MPENGETGVSKASSVKLSPRRGRCVTGQTEETPAREMKPLPFPCTSELNGVNCDPPELRVNADLFWQIWLKSLNTVPCFLHDMLLVPKSRVL